MYNDFKVFLRRADISIGSTADLSVPVRLSSSGSMMNGSWHVAAESRYPLFHTGIGFTRGLAVVSDTFANVYSGISVITYLERSNRIHEVK